MNPSLIGNVITLVLAFLGFVGTISVLIMNLRVTQAVTQSEAKFAGEINSVRLTMVTFGAQASKDSGEVKLELANIRTRLAEDRANLYREIMSQMESRFMDRALSMQMHRQNEEKFEGLAAAVNDIKERLPV